MLRLGRYRFAPSLAPTVLAAAGIALLSGLGLWQLERASGKEARIEAYEAAQGIVLDESAADRPAVEFARVDLEGRFDGAHQFLQDNRTHAGRAGYYVLTPFRTAGRTAVLVNRGWVPADPDRSALPDVEVAEDRVRVRGTVRIARQDLLVLGDTGYGASQWPRVVQRVELDSMERRLGYPLAGWLVSLDPDMPNGYVREWTVSYGLAPSRHRGYAFQWFALAAALLAIWVVVNLKRR